MSNEKRPPEEKKELAPVQVQAFSSMSGFEIAQRMAKALAESDLVPQMYRGKLSNCLVALEISQRCQASVLMVMQNLYVIQGKPSWSSQYIIAALNSCGKFSPIRFKMDDKKTECTAWAEELRTGQILEGPKVDMAMAKAEGWSTKSGSKWVTMPDLMLRYRAAAFFGRLYAPEVLMGLSSREENEEIVETTGKYVKSSAAVEELSKKLHAAAEAPAIEVPAVPVVPEVHPDFEKAYNELPDPRIVK